MVKLLLALALTGSAQQYGLVCTGTQTGPNGQTEPFKIEFHIDLETERYCWNKCTHMSKVHAVNENYIILENGGSRAARVESTVYR
ncbi:MAG: hypothetical protein ABL962_11050, partial [Fimbriimonadaceae bacterium]